VLSFNVTNIGNIGKEIYVWHRIGQNLSVFKDNTFFPYFYQIAPNGLFKTIDNQKVNKILCSRPSDLSRRRDEGSYEADVSFSKRYIIDKIGSFGKAELKYSFIDIEVLCPELPSYLDPKYPISSISCSNSYTGEIKTFFLLDYMSIDTQCNIKESDIEDAEKNLLDEFTYWVKAEMFDLSLGWNFIEFDWRYLRARYNYIFGCELSEMLSPIGQSKYLGSSQSEEAQNLIPMGMSVMDYLDMYKKIYKTESSYALDAIVNKHLNIPLRKKIDFNKLSEEIKIKNREDVRLLMEIDKKFKIVDYYDELRRMSMCEWTDVTWNSKMLDVILLREAKNKNIVLPSKHYGEGQEVNAFVTEDTFQGAYRRCDTGLYKNLWKLDLSSAYPMAIINFCLDIANIKNEGIEINHVKFYQNSNALLPTIAQKLINKKDILKKQLKITNPETEEYKDLQTKYDAIKAVVNSLFGVCGLKVFRLFDYRVASSITFIVRDLLHYVENKLIEQGMKVIYVDTDSVFVDAKENPKDLCNALIKEWAKIKYNKDNVGIEFDLEGTFEKIFIIALCHYKGYLRTKSGLKEEVKGIEAKRKDSSVFIKEFQNILIDKIMNEETKEDIFKWITAEKLRIKTLPILDIGFPCKISKAAEEYKSIPVHIRALAYTKEIIPTFDKRTGDSFYYIYVEPFGTAMRKSTRNKKDKDTGDIKVQSSDKQVNKDVLVFDEDNYAHVKNVDWKKMLDRSIYSKIEHIFEALEWDITEIKEVKIKKERKKKTIVDAAKEMIIEGCIEKADSIIKEREGRQIDKKEEER